MMMTLVECLLVTGQAKKSPDIDLHTLAFFAAGAETFFNLCFFLGFSMSEN